MDSSPTPEYSPVNASITPRRPPRPVSLMPVVVEYPPSIRNVSPENERSIRPASIWSADYDDVPRKGCAGVFSPPGRPTSKAQNQEDGGKRRRLKILLAILAVILIILAAVLGGVLGSRAASNKHGSQGATIQPPGTVSSMTPESSSTLTWASLLPSSSSEPGPRGTLQKGSRIGATTAMPFDNPFRMTVFISLDGHLATSIWTGSKMESFAVIADDGSHIPKPAMASPLHLIVLGHSDNVHILFVDEDFYICLATVSPRGSDRGSAKWKGGRLETGDDGTENSKPETHKTTADFRIAFEVHNNVDDTYFGRPADRVNILYQEGSKKIGGEDKYTLLSSITPDDPSQWYASTYKLSEDQKSSMDPQAESQGLAVVPTFREKEKEPGKQSGVRIIWDLSSQEHDTTFGVMKCKMKNVTDLGGCWSDMGNWKNDNEHEKVLSAPKPLTFSVERIPATDRSPPQAFVLFILDGDGKLSELYWDGAHWNGLRQFAAVDEHSANATHAFSSFAVTADGHLFAIADGTMFWYRRMGNWWDADFSDKDPAWKLLDVVNTTLVPVDAR